MATVGIDLDGVICTEEKTFERSLAVPLPGAISSLEAIRDAGHVIIIWTARGWGEFKMTIEWLAKNNVPYDHLVMGKPIFDVFLDDRAISHNSWEHSLSILRDRSMLPAEGMENVSRR